MIDSSQICLNVSEKLKMIDKEMEPYKEGVPEMVYQIILKHKIEDITLNIKI